jgi:phytoene dehydrogenase-like protein
VSIPSVHDDTLAPDNEAVLHAYTPATEDYEKWANLDCKSDEYKALKEERSQYLWQVLEKIIPDIRSRATHIQVGTPLTHKRFLRRHKGSYGPAIKAGEGSFPFPGTPVKGLLMTGDSMFPGIGVPAVAGSGLVTANSISFDSIKPQLKVLDSLKKRNSS